MIITYPSCALMELNDHADSYNTLAPDILYLYSRLYFYLPSNSKIDLVYFQLISYTGSANVTWSPATHRLTLFQNIALSYRLFFLFPKIFKLKINLRLTKISCFSYGFLWSLCYRLLGSIDQLSITWSLLHIHKIHMSKYHTFPTDFFILFIFPI